MTTLHDGIAFGDSAKLGWYSSFSSFRFLSTGETNLGLYFNNKNNYTFSSINNSVAKTDFLSNGRFTLGTGNLFASRRNSIVIPKNNNDTTAIIQSVGSPYAMLDFRANSGGFAATLSGQSLGNIYGEQGELIYPTPSSMNLKAAERLNIRHNHSLRVWEGNTLRIQQVGDKIGVNPFLNFFGRYSTPIANLDVNGNIRSSILAGTGKRLVFADENGILEANTYQEVISYGINHILPGDEDYSYTIDFNTNLVSLQPSIQAEYLRCPLNLPNGAQIKNIKIHYRENSPTKNLFIQFIGHSHTSQFYQVYQDLLLVNNTSAMQIATLTPNHAVNNSLASYSLVFSVKETGGAATTWPSDQIAIRSVIVTVEY
ncbi:MAG: hypothetical protein NWQ46_09610 [Spirosomaceae bacterium]|nr:hypothetical protein [Spirosomataceae bacterium]